MNYSLNTSKTADLVMVKTLENWFVASSDIPPAGSVSSPSFGSNQSKKFYLTLSKASLLDEEVSFNLHLNSKYTKKVEWFKCFYLYQSMTAYDRQTNWVYSHPITDAFLPHKTVVHLGTFRSVRYWNIMFEITFVYYDEEPSDVVSKTDHATQFSAQMSTLRLDASSADITLLTTADGRSFPAHKLILSTRSPVFAAMFRNGDFTENQKKLVEIDDISGEVMEGLLKYVYECNVQGIEKIVCGLLTAADKYDIPHLVRECIQVMSNNLSVTNAASFFYYANLHQFENLKIQIGAFIVANKGAVRQSEGFKECIKLHSDLVDQFIDLII